MKSIMKFFTLLLCLELIVSPIHPQLSLLGQQALATDCGVGFEFNSTLNRCLTKTETAQVMNATASCAADDHDCYRRNAENAFQGEVNAGEAPERKDNNEFMSTVGQAAAIAVPLAMAVGSLNNSMSQCASVSFWSMVAGSASLVIGDNLANHLHAKEIEDIKESWGEIVNPEGANGDKDKEREASIEAQSMAFEKLAEAEDQMVKTAKLKRTFFLIATLAYTVSAAAAIYESIMVGLTSTVTTCKIVGLNEYRGKKSLYVEYTSGTNDPFILSNQFTYNLHTSKDLVSFIMNQKASTLKNSSPTIDEYEDYQKAFELSSEDKKLAFEVFKEISITILSNMNPIPNALALREREAIRERETVDGGAGGGGGGRRARPTPSAEPEVNTNAAKAFKEDQNKGINWVGMGIGVGAGLAAGIAIRKQTEGYMMYPIGRAAWSTVLAGWTGVMADHANSQAKASEKRAKLLREMKADFATAAGAIYACKSEDRNDPNKPTCYCYTPDNKRNQNRGSSDVCAKLWAGKSLTPTNYLAGGKTKSRICINNQNKADPACACKQTKSCMKVSLSGLKGISPGTFSMMSQALGPLNSVADGSADAGSINAGALDEQAARMKAFVKKLENTKAGKGIKNKKDKLAKQISSGLIKAGAGISPSSILGSSGSGMPSNPGEAARMLEKEIASNAPTAIGSKGGNSLAAPGGSTDPMAGLEFGLTPDQLAAQEGQIAEVMQEDLDFGGNDINQGSSANIFEVLSNRYQRSGMRRLFDEKGVTEAEKPAASDIVQ